ncbi:MAG: OmpH family outer membrane protein [Akkermansiaceae bacterium]
MNIFRQTFSLVATALFFLPLHAQEERDDKIATVNMQRLVADFHKTKAVNETFAKYGEEIKLEDTERMKAIKAADDEAKKLQEAAKENNISSEEKSDLFRQSTAKQREARALFEERSSWVKRKQAALNDQAKIEFGKIRKELMGIVQEVGETEGYDFIFDRSAGSGAGVAIMVYTKDATDLTGLLLERINKDAPTEEKEGE